MDAWEGGAILFILMIGVINNIFDGGGCFECDLYA